MVPLSEVGETGAEADMGGIMSSALEKLGFERPNGHPSRIVEQAGRGLGWRYKCAISVKQYLKL